MSMLSKWKLNKDNKKEESKGVCNLRRKPESILLNKEQQIVPLSGSNGFWERGND
jgi:hypothetical protein